MKMIDKEMVVFLQGVLHTFSMIIESTVTIVTIDTDDTENESHKLDFLKFYDHLPSDCITRTTEFNLFELEEVFKKELFKEPSSLQLTQDKKDYIAYKIMDYLIMCIKDNETLSIDEWQVKKMDFMYKGSLSSSFAIYKPNVKQSMVLIFWNE